MCIIIIVYDIIYSYGGDGKWEFENRFRDGHTDGQTHRSTYRGGAHLTRALYFLEL